MIFIKKYRNEWKYILSNQELFLLKSRLSNVLEYDSHSTNGKYFIHSLYFDDYFNTSLYTTSYGVSKRYKWRIRYYDNDLSYLVLEKKEKLEGRCHKKSCRLTMDEYNLIVSSNISELMYDTNKDLIKELCVDMLMYDYRPKVIIDYERIAFVEEITNVRITFDMKISAAYQLDRFLLGDYNKFLVDTNNMNVLEVKFDEILPSYIRDIVESYGYVQTSFSKYMYGRKLMNGVII